MEPAATPCYLMEERPHRQLPSSAGGGVLSAGAYGAVLRPRSVEWALLDLSQGLLLPTQSSSPSIRVGTGDAVAINPSGTCGPARRPLY